MQYRQLGRWGVKVSVVSLGSWLTYGGSTSEQTALKCIRRAYELGVNLFDTANEYQVGHAEEALGNALSGIERDKFLVATKVCLPMGDGPLDSGLSRKHIMAQVDGSLRRLGMDHIDLYQCHRYDTQTPLEETAKAMSDLVRAGKVLYWGVSEWSAHQIEDVVTLCKSNRWSVPVANQPQYSALWRGIEQHVLPTCEMLGLGVLAWSPLAMGVLTGKYRPGVTLPPGTRRASVDGWFLDRYMNPDVLSAVQEFQALAINTGTSASQLALNWCLRRSSISSVITGATNLTQLEENIAAAELTIDSAVLRRAGDILEPVAVG